MIPQWIIEKKRDGKALEKEEIRAFINGYAADEIPDYQMSALAMAIYLQGMTYEETAVLTNVMMNSGNLVDTSSVTRPKADKHSTGGIGDKVSLILAPLVACCGIGVPMISGRGLGITGGTLDKMESIAGYRTDLSEQEFVKVVRDCGCSIIGQTAELAPADKKLYALRDVTATVPSIPLITASIMCKKMAEGIDVLVLDVKYGSGAFMKTLDDARKLAWSMVNTGSAMGKKVVAVLTGMDEPLGCEVGNALEVKESIECLGGNGAEDLMEVTLALSAQMLLLTNIAKDEESALSMLKEKIESGAALEKFKEMVGLHGGDISMIDDPSKLPEAEIANPLLSPAEGTVVAVDAGAVGRAALLLGAGRVKTSDKVDHAVGISSLAKIGMRVSKGDTLAIIHARDTVKMEEAGKMIAKAFKITHTASAPSPRIKEIVR